MAASSIFDRRQVLQAAATFVVSAASKTAFADDFGYIDAHSHLWSIDRVDYPLAPRRQGGGRPTEEFRCG